MSRISDQAQARQARHKTDIPLSPTPAMIIVGKDVLELLSSAMYVDPLSIYREYVQNAADAIDDARQSSVLGDATPGEVRITVDAVARRIAIRDNGAGIPIGDAPRRLLAIGASGKRGSRARGFRGVGRLAGLAYGRTLTFRTRSPGDAHVIELRWDCQRLKAALRDVTQSDDISSVIQRIVSIAYLEAGEWPEHFFEVELSDVIRTKRDALLNPTQIEAYLEQVAPVPFAADFTWADRIVEHIRDVRLGDLKITINAGKPLQRPLRDAFNVTDSISDTFDNLELITISDLDGGVAAVGWMLHHGYRGSITVRSRVGGLRGRVGNVQIGEHNLFEDIFPEARFNGWSVGEVHILDPRIVPNARRDHFEQNVHYSNLTAQLEPIGRQVAKRARVASVARNAAKHLVQQTPTAPATDSSAAQGPAVETASASTSGVERSQPACETHISNAPIRLSLTQRQLVRKIQSLIRQSGLSNREWGEILSHLR